MKIVFSTRYIPRLAAALVALLSVVAAAQPIYRIVGPDGRIIFSDKPPATDGKVTTLSANGRPEAEGAGDLPYELREVVNRYPVTLYTTANSEPSSAGRQLLQSRGVPYTERTINTDLDIEASKRLGLEGVVPVIIIGSQRLRGFSEPEWNEYLDLAGYPKTSRLPAGYRNPAPTPLAPPSASGAERPPIPIPATPTLVSPPPPAPPPANPSGIVF